MSQYGGSLDNLLSRRGLYQVARRNGRESDEYKTDYNAYIRYLRCVKIIEILEKELGIATGTTGLTSVQEVNIPQYQGVMLEKEQIMLEKEQFVKIEDNHQQVISRTRK